MDKALRDWLRRAQNRWRVIRTSNAYTFVDPKPVTSVDRFSSRSELPTGTEGQEFNLEIPRVSKPQLDPANPLHQALSRLGHALKEERSRA
jgi:hypothetical protein